MYIANDLLIGLLQDCLEWKSSDKFGYIHWTTPMYPNVSIVMCENVPPEVFQQMDYDGFHNVDYQKSEVKSEVLSEDSIFIIKSNGDIRPAIRVR